MIKCILLFISGSFLAIGTSLALGIRNGDQDAEATARGEAFTATADNPSAIYYNPAGITQLEGWQIRSNLYAIDINVKVQPSDGSAAQNQKPLNLVPNFFATWSPKHSPLTFGLGVYSPYGLAIQYPVDTSFRTESELAKITYFSVNPVVAWKVCKTLSIAAGPTFDYANVEQTRGVFAPDDQFRLNGSGTGVGCNAGILWQPVPEHSFGVHYHSATDVELSGHTTVDTNAFAVSTPLGPVTIPAVHTRDPANARFHFPQFVTVGYSFRPTPDWNLEANVDWTDWDSLNSVIVHQSNSPSLEFPFDWKSSFAYEFGVTRYFEHGFHASAGYIYSEQTVPNATFTPGIPDGRRDIFSVGVGQRVGRINWDLSYQYTHQLDRSITNGTAVDGVYHLNANAISLALGYTF